MSNLLKIKRPFASKTENMKSEKLKTLAKDSKTFEDIILDISKQATTAKRIFKDLEPILVELRNCDKIDDKSKKLISKLKERATKFNKSSNGVSIKFDEIAAADKFKKIPHAKRWK